MHICLLSTVNHLNKIFIYLLLLLLSGCDSSKETLTSIKEKLDETIQQHIDKPEGPIPESDVVAPEPKAASLEPLQAIRTMPLDLSIPEQNNEHLPMGEGFSAELLPDLFSDAEKTEQEAGKTSFGGRLVLDEDSEEYSMDSVRGAELTLEVLTP